MSSVDAWVDNFRSQTDDRVGAGIPWLDSLRERAIERFATTGWPTTRQDGWRHTSLAALQKLDFTAAGAKADPASIRALLDGLRHNEPGHWLVFIDGRYAADFSDIGTVPQGARILPLSQALSQQADEVQGLFGDEAQGSTPAALSTAMAGDGGFITLEQGVCLDQPVHLVFVNATDGGAAFPRNLISAGKGAAATVVEHYVSALDPAVAATGNLTNAVTRARIATDANVTHLKLQIENEQAFHLASIHAEQDEHSTFNSHSMSFGARLARNDIATRFNGQRCETLLNGLYYVNGRRHVDHNTLIDHAHPNGVSREYYRGILADTGRGVFGGRILVAPGADGTDAVQRSDSLLLSRLARSDAKPELEIYADDVQCAHGATVGQIDEEAMFYLRARGLDEAYARNVLTYAFAAAAVNRLPLAGLQRRVTHLIRQRLPGGDDLEDIE